MNKLNSTIFGEIDYDLINSGVSQEASQLNKQYYDLTQHYFEPYSRTSLEEKFSTLSETWKYDNANVSSVNQLVLHPTYQEIIGMGKQAIPFILLELKKSPRLWFWALKSITGDNPVPEEDIGNIPKMTTHWLNWGRDRGYIN